MVFQTLVNFVRARGPDEFWRKRKIFKLTAHYIGRRRNCYSLAIRNVQRALVYATKARPLKKEDMKRLWDTRITAGCEQFAIEGSEFREGLLRSGIQLNRKVLSELAAWEPRTFEALALTSREKAAQDGMLGLHERNFENNVYFYNDEKKQNIDFNAKNVN